MSKTLSRFVEPKGSGISNPLRQTNWAPLGPNLFGGEGWIDSLASLVHPCGARFARPNRLCRFVEPCCLFRGFECLVFLCF